MGVQTGSFDGSCAPGWEAVPLNRNCRMARSVPVYHTRIDLGAPTSYSSFAMLKVPLAREVKIGSGRSSCKRLQSLEQTLQLW